MEPVYQSVLRQPAPALRPFIERYVGYRLTGYPAGVHRGLPSRHLTLIVSIGDPIDVVRQTDPGQSPGSYRFVAGGLQLTPALIRHDGDQEGVAFELTPLGARAVLGLPASAIWSTSLEANDLLGTCADELWDRLQEPAGWAERFALCDAILARRLTSLVPVRDELREAWRRLACSGGSVPIEELAGEVGWSRRHLGQRFTGEFGLSPKSAARLIRFDRARRLLERPDRPALAAVAAACGYYDQPHLNRDFVELAGCPPGEWLATEDLPSVQDTVEVDSAGSAA